MIDDNLMSNALKVSGLKTKKDAVEEGLRLLVQRNAQREIRKLRGQINWDGDLSQMRGAK